MAKRAAAQPSHGGGEDAESGHVALQSQHPGRVASQPLQPEPKLPAPPGLAVPAGTGAPPEPALLLALRSIPEISPAVAPMYCPKSLARRFGKVLAALLQDLFLAVDARADDIVLETKARTLRLASHGAASA